MKKVTITKKGEIELEEMSEDSELNKMKEEYDGVFNISMECAVISFNHEKLLKLEKSLNSYGIDPNTCLILEKETISLPHVACKINGVPVRALIDSGTATDCLSKSFAQRNNFGDKIDETFKGTPIGFGGHKILGRIIEVSVKIEEVEFLLDFDIPQNSIASDMIIGANTLHRLKCIVDLQSKELSLGSHSISTPFLTGTIARIPRKEVILPSKDQEVASANQTPEPLRTTSGNLPALKCRLNQVTVTALIDTGAIRSYLSTVLVEYCNLQDLMVKLSTPLQETIVGLVKNAPLQIAESNFQLDFAVRQNEDVHMVLGMDLLRDHQWCINFESATCFIGSTSTTVPYTTSESN